MRQGRRRGRCFRREAMRFAHRGCSGVGVEEGVYVAYFAAGRTI